ncbi:MAG: hypothetical protein HND48_06020 [Chloroflexi bacterium]|nr:hypothetical protein [Chloroflexota bacterium]
MLGIASLTFMFGLPTYAAVYVLPGDQLAQYAVSLDLRVYRRRRRAGRVRR